MDARHRQDCGLVVGYKSLRNHVNLLKGPANILPMNYLRSTSACICTSSLSYSLPSSNWVANIVVIVVAGHRREQCNYGASSDDKQRSPRVFSFHSGSRAASVCWWHCFIYYNDSRRSTRSGSFFIRHDTECTQRAQCELCSTLISNKHDDTRERRWNRLISNILDCFVRFGGRMWRCVPSGRFWPESLFYSRRVSLTVIVISSDRVSLELRVRLDMPVLTGDRLWGTYMCDAVWMLSQIAADWRRVHLGLWLTMI